MTTVYTIYDQSKCGTLGFVKDAARPFLVISTRYAGYKRGYSSNVIGRYSNKKAAQQAIRRDRAK